MTRNIQEKRMKIHSNSKIVCSIHKSNNRENAIFLTLNQNKGIEMRKQPGERWGIVSGRVE